VQASGEGRRWQAGVLGARRGHLGTIVENFYVEDFGADRVDDAAAEEEGAEELEDRSYGDSLRDVEGARADGGGEGVGQVVGPNTVRCEDGADGPYNDDPGISELNKANICPITRRTALKRGVGIVLI